MSAESHTALADAAPSTVSTPTVAAAPEAPTKPAEAPVEVPTRQDPVPGDPDQQDEPDIDEQGSVLIVQAPEQIGRALDIGQ